MQNFQEEENDVKADSHSYLYLLYEFNPPFARTDQTSKTSRELLIFLFERKRAKFSFRDEKMLAHFFFC